LSKDETWRELFGKPGIRAEEQELILRFLALHFDFADYRGNLVDFLNHFMLKNQRLDLIPRLEMEKVFLNTLNFLKDCIGPQVFAHNKSFNKVLFDAVMLLASRRLNNSMACEGFKRFYESLNNDEHFWSMSRQATTSKKNFTMRSEYVEELYEKTQ
jgi:hypothetical protein